MLCHRVRVTEIPLESVLVADRRCPRSVVHKINGFRSGTIGMSCGELHFQLAVQGDRCALNGCLPALPKGFMQKRSTSAESGFGLC